MELRLCTKGAVRLLANYVAICLNLDTPKIQKCLFGSVNYFQGFTVTANIRNTYNFIVLQNRQQGSPGRSTVSACGEEVPVPGD